MSAKLHLRLVTPTSEKYDDDVEMVIVRSTEGEIAFMANHCPLTTLLDYGVAKIYTGSGEPLEASVFGGFAVCQNNRVTILADASEWPDEIDVERAEDAAKKAERDISTPGDVEHRHAELALRRANVRLDVSSYSIIKGRESTFKD